MNITKKRPLVLRDYQTPASDFAMAHDKVVLAVAPNGGKTEIAIDVICRYLDLYPKSRVLVFTHSTIVLKDNFTSRHDELDIPYDYSTTFDPNYRIHICLPQNENKIIGNYDFLIVDEAHENYFAEQVTRIIQRVKPKKQLLLTGTPSKFIREKENGYSFYYIACNDLPKEYSAKLNIELVASNYNWSYEELNNQLEIKEKYLFTEEDTEKTLETIILKLIERVNSKVEAKQFNIPSFLTKFKNWGVNKLNDWGITYKKLGKTIIVCRSINQSQDVNNILLKHNVNSILSNSESDKDSNNIVKFKNNEYDVLVVVDRARLGYSDADLFNIIDMSGTHNPDIIYQMFSRVLRGTQDMQKYYLKVTTQENGMMDYTHACVSAALMLTDKKYISEWNGKNFNGIIIPVLSKNPNDSNSSDSDCSSTKKSKTKKFYFPEFAKEIDIINFFKSVICNLDNPVSIYKTTTIGEVKSILYNRANPNFWTKDNCREDALKYTTKKDWEKNSKSAYNKAHKNDWLDYCCEHMKTQLRWTIDKVKEDALKYSTRSEWSEKSCSAYSAARKNGWLDECCLHMKNKKTKPVGYWTKEKVKEDALKYTVITHWQKNSVSAYDAARKNGWLDECRSHMIKDGRSQNGKKN